MKVKYRNVQPEDLLLVFNWANEPEVRSNSYNPEFITLEEHTKWFKQKIEEETSLFFIAEIEGEPAGMVRFEIGDENAVISIIIDKHFRGRKLASVFLTDCCNFYFEKNSKPIFAWIKSDNEPSIHAFRRANFSFLKEETINNIKSQVFKKENV